MYAGCEKETNPPADLYVEHSHNGTLKGQSTNLTCQSKFSRHKDATPNQG